MNKKNFIILIGVLSIAIYMIVTNYALKDINKDEIDANRFIEIVDEVSDNKTQINWKEVVAIVGVIEKNDFTNINEDEVKEVANMFLKEENKEYKLNSLEEVLKKLEFSKRQIKLTYSYIDQLQNFGLMPDRLDKNSKYMKFINSIKDDAIDNYKKHKILPSITIAQAILESGWGDSALAKNYNNLFGIKADVYWEGEHVTLQTREFQDDIVNDKFRKYEDPGESINDHGEFLANNKRYKLNGVFDANTYTYQAKALQKAGYSTDTGEDGELVYASRLIQIIRQYNLQLIDIEAKK